MKRVTRKHLSWSLLFCILLPVFIPSVYLEEGMGRYAYGFPMKYITIYQHEPNSVWFFDNFFNGNAGLGANPAIFILNLVFIYLIVRFVANKMKMIKKVEFS